MSYWVGSSIIAGLVAFVLSFCILFTLHILLGGESNHVPGDTPSLYDAPWYYYKVEDKVYRVVILRDGTHTLIEEPVLEGLP